MKYQCDKQIALHGRGFTLVELAIVLIIVALLLGGMMTTLSAQNQIRHNQETLQALAEAREALIGFATVNGRLPRPTSSASNGLERGVCANDIECTGFIPWQTLGINKLDGWGKLIRYSVTPDFSSSPTVLILTTTATKKIQTRDNAGGAGTTYLVGQTGNCNGTDQQCSPAVIFSHGNRNFGTTDSGIALGNTSTTNADEATNDVATTTFISRTMSDSPTAQGGEFDDIVIWISPNILFNRMIAAGKLP